jgi:dihydroorotase
VLSPTATEAARLRRTGDLLLRGGTVFDADRAEFVRADVGIEAGRVRELRPDIGTAGYARVLDVTDRIVSPGLVDFHAHVFRGQDLGLDADVIGPRSGTTTYVDAGSAGAHLFGAFLRSTVQAAIPRIVAFLNISTIGTTSILLAGELANLDYCDEAACESAVARYSDHIVGIKVRASGNVAGPNGLEALGRALRVAERVGLPVMVHVGPKPPTIERIFDLLRPGDIVTHCFTGLDANGAAANGATKPAARAAYERGVAFDVGHGMGGFDVTAARTMIEAGLPPHAISTDLHAYSTQAVADMCAVLTKFLALGLSVGDVLARATISPARLVGLDRQGVGVLRVGGPADVAVLSLEDAHVELTDTVGNVFHGSRRLTTVTTIQAGRIVHER